VADKRKPSKKPVAEANEAVDTAQEAATGMNVDDAERTPDESPEAAEQSAESAETGQTDLPAEDEAPIPAPQAEPVVIHKAGFFPMLLGGVAAAVIGFGVARYALPDGWLGADDGAFQADVATKLDAQAAALADLRAEAGKAPDFSPLQGELAAIQTAVDTLAGQIGDANSRLQMLDTRLTDLEKRPITQAASPAAVAAYERELKALQAAMMAQRQEIEKIAAEAARKEASAEMTAQDAMQRAALSRIQTALDTGTGFADAASNLQATGITLPPDLMQVATDGVATRNDLAQAFPEAARAALAVARKAEGGGGLGGFLKTQLGARSLEPREGDDPDAVLSRAEAAVNDGRLGDAVSELEALPEQARVEMTDWLSRAASRLAALRAADALASELN
jgi:hypothetical protein